MSETLQLIEAEQKDSRTEEEDKTKDGHEKEENKTKLKKNKGEPKIKKKGNKYKHDKIVLSLNIHCMDRTEGIPILLTHPVVEVFICNADEGQLLKKSWVKRKVTSYYEDPEIDYILPMMSQPFNIKKERSLFCQWNESLVFNESINYLKECEPEVIIFFHLKNFHSAQGSKSKRSSTVGWQTFAWSFLKVKSSNGTNNIGNRLRLQLYRPRKLTDVGLCDIYSWWKSGSRRKYNSSLHVSPNEIILPENPVASHRSFLPNQREVSKQKQNGSNIDLGSAANSSVTNISITNNHHVKWTKQDNEPFTIPNYVSMRLPTLGYGCMVAKFSPDGFKLSCGSKQVILIYDVLSGQLLYCLSGHTGLVYCLDWSLDNQRLLSCSADATARVWHFRDTANECQMEALTHPSYVYSAKFSPLDQNVVITGCFDFVLRVWGKKSNGKYVLMQELNEHLGFISSLVFYSDGTSLYSGDKQGIIISWRVNPLRNNIKEAENYLQQLDTIKRDQIFGVPINHLVLHPANYRILVHTKDSCIRLVNKNNLTITQTLQGILNTKERILSCISPCGTWVLSGSEDGSLSVWDAETGLLYATMLDLPFETTVSCVDFHPHDNIIVAVSHDSGSSIVLLKYDDKKAPVHNVPMDVLPLEGQMTPTSDLNRQLTPLLSGRGGPTKHWRDVGKDLLVKLDFILKAATEETSLHYKKEKGDRSLVEAIALYSYKSTAADEASIKKGEIITIVKQSNADWWVIERDNGRRGLVPSSYLRVNKGQRKRRSGHQQRQDFTSEEKSVRPRTNSYSECTTVTTQSRARLRRQRNRSGEV